MKNLINIVNLSKKYSNEDYIIKKFNYSFNQVGFYVLFGQSGCGKTTILNILYGITEYDKGKINFLGREYSNKLDETISSSYMAYLTQENYFIDYLTVKDNIALCSKDQKRVKLLLKKFKLEDKLALYPKNLSKGEQQRLSLLQALLKNKKIILLDEPTSALDPENKRVIFELLSSLKKDVLIICACHDPEILHYCDEIIDFSKLNDYKINSNQLVENLKLEEQYSTDNLFHYMKKQKDKKTIKNRILMFMILFICFILCFFCLNVKQKLINTIQNKYKVNYLTVYCPNDKKSCNDILKNKHVSEANYVYSLNIPLKSLNEVSDGYVGNLNFETSIVTLPSNKDNFPLTHKIIVGDYFNSINEIILGYDLAMELSENKVDEILGKNIALMLPDGEQVFTVIGVFEKFNGKYNEKYINDNVEGYNEEMNSKIVYYIYFDNFNELYNINEAYNTNEIYEDNIYIKSLPSQYIDFIDQFSLLSVFIIPIVIATIIISTIFYFQTIILDINYNIHIIGVYKFYGYSLSSIKKGFILTNLRNVTKCFIYSLISAIILSIILNQINYHFNLFDYQLFNVNYVAIILMYLLMTLISLISIKLLCRNIEKKGWYKLIKNGGDLI